MTIILTREEAQQVLDVLNAWRTSHIAQPLADISAPLIETLRARLSAPEPEPVAWMNPDWLTYTRAPAPVVCYKENWTPLYTAPPQREWQGLTDEEIYACSDTPWTPTGLKCIRAIEAKLREKNT